MGARARIIVAVAVGLIVALLPLALRLAVDSQVLELLAAPGALTVILIWGPHGPVPSDAIALAVMIGVSTIVYSLVAFFALKLFRR